MAYKKPDYQPDRWRDYSIIAQASAKVVADILPLLTPPEGEPGDWFREWHRLVFDSTVELANLGLADSGVADLAKATAKVQEVFPGATVVSNGSDGSLPYENVEVKFGKHKGMTLGEIDKLDEGDSTGRSYIEWIADKSDNPFMKKAATAFLAAANAQ